ncbi:hypothetical protein HN903_02315 [archaeon]|jgi:HTH-type transcriptional regulator, sugar sensing transcriptional regulator|nr:hypothetical protein [archaeon]MBT6955870.1 hypothetical protein [archaeon]MBT7128567.1 hypothetical protein [archaeon]
MEDTILQDAGLTKGETKVYLALLTMNESTVGPIAKKASVSLSKIYEILNNLAKKGLVTSIIKSNINHFVASDPERILEYMEKRKKKISLSEEKIKQILPSLKLRKKEEKESLAKLYEGTKGIKTFYEEMLRGLKKEDVIYGMGIPKYAAEEHEGYFLDFNKRRSKKEVQLKAIYNYDAKEAGKKREKIPFTKIKYLPKKFTSPSWIIIFKDTVATIHMIGKPICVVIQDQNVSESYLNFFNSFWNLSK